MIVEKCSSKIHEYGSKTAKEYGWVFVFLILWSIHPRHFLRQVPPVLRYIEIAVAGC